MEVLMKKVFVLSLVFIFFTSVLRPTDWGTAYQDILEIVKSFVDTWDHIDLLGEEDAFYPVLYAALAYAHQDIFKKYDQDEKSEECKSAVAEFLENEGLKDFVGIIFIGGDENAGENRKRLQKKFPSS